MKHLNWMFAILVMTVLIAVPCAVSKSVHSKNESYFRVTFIKKVDGIMTHEYVFEIQNLDSKSRKFYLGGLFQQTDFPLSEIHNVKIYEYEPIKKTYPVYRQENVTIKYTVNQTNQKIPNNCWWIIKNKTYACNITRTISDGTKVKSVLSWVELNITRENKFLNKISSRHGTVRKGKQKTMIFKHAVVVLPPYGSKCKYDDLGNPYDCNGTKIFKVVFTTPIEKNGKGWGSSGLFAVYDYNTNEYFHPWWNSTWQYRRQINITGSYTDLYNYQVAINLTYDSNMNPDFSDIRFTWLNQTSNTEVEIPYWIESKVNSSWAYVWVKVPYIPANSTAILYVYYGNPNAKSKSNESLVMDVFEDFEGYSTGALNGQNGWWYDSQILTLGNTYVAGSITVENTTSYSGLQAIEGSGSAGDHECKNIYISGAPGFILQFEEKQLSTGNFLGIYLNDTNGEWIGAGMDYPGTATTDPVMVNGTNKYVTFGSAIALSTWVKLTVVYINGHADVYAYNGTVTYTLSTSTVTMSTIHNICVVDNGATANAIWDDIVVRKYANPQPTYTIGSEQAPPNFYSVTYSAPSNYSAYQKTTVTVNWTTSPGYTVNNAYLEINATGTYKNYTMSAGTGGIFTWSNVLPAGYFCFRSYGNSTGVWNKTSQYCLKINKATPQTEIDMINDSVVYGSSYWNNAWVYPFVNISNNLPVLIYRNNVLIENDSGLVARWSFDDGSTGYAKDNSGNMNTAKLHNMYAFKFNGRDSYIDLNYPTNYLLWDEAFSDRTVCIKFFVHDTITKQMLYEEGGSVNGMNLYVFNGSIWFGAWAKTNGWNGAFLSYPISAYTTYYVCGVFEGNLDMKLYVNGVLENSTSVPTTMAGHPDYDAIGKVEGSTVTNNGIVYGPADYLSGEIYEYVLWTTNLTSTQINDSIKGKFDIHPTVLYEPLDGVIQNGILKDLSGNGYNVVPHYITYSPWVNGKFGKALSFDGVDDYVSVPDSALELNQSQWTWSAWINPLGYISQEAVISNWQGVLKLCAHYPTEGLTSVCMQGSWTNGTTVFWGGVLYNVSDSELYGKYNFVASVYDRPCLKLYFDGKLVSERCDILYNERLSQNANIGGWQNDGIWFGSIDEVRIYNRALSDEEIKELYLYGSSKFAAGTYNYNITVTGNQNYTSSSISRTFTILKATPDFVFDANGNELGSGQSITLQYPVTVNITVSGCPTQGASDVFCQLWRNDTGMVENTTGVSSFNYVFKPAVGAYEFTVNNTEGQNWTTRTLDPLIVVTQGNVNVSLSYQNITYGDAELITCHANNTDTTANLTLWLNNTLLAYNQSSTPTINYYLANYSFPSGIYYLICNISATQNFTAAENKQAFNISKATPLLNEYIPSNRTYNGTASISNFSVSTHNNQVYCSLYMNGSLVGTTNTYITDARASGGIYTYTFSCPETQNYTSAEISGAYEIYKATPTLTEQIPNNKTYDGNISIANFTIQTINNQLYAVLELNNNTVGNTTTTISDSRDSAGIYCYYFYTNGNENYTSNSVQACYEIYKATPILNLYIDGKYENKTITWLNISTITANESNSGDSDVVYCMYRNSTLINCQTGNAKIINATQLQSGTYVFTFNNTAGQNYTASSIKLYLTVKKAWNQTNNIYAGKPYMYDLGVEGIPISIHVNRFQDPNRITESGGYAYNLLNVTIFNNGTYYGVEPTNFTNIHVNVTEIMPDGWSSNIDNYTVSELNSGTSNTTYVPIRKFGVINDSLYSISALNKSVVVGKPLYVNFTFIVNNTDTIPYRNVLVNLSDDGIESAWSSILNASFVDLNANSTKKISSVVNKTTVYEVSYLISRADIDYLRKYTYIATLNVTENTVTKNLSIIYKIPLSRLTEWSYKSSVSVLVDGSNKNVSIVGNAVIIGNEHTNSSLHYGTHTVTLVYYVPITPAGGGGGGVSYIPSTNETVYISNLKPEEKVPVSVVLMGKNINVTIISDNGSVVYNKMLNGVDRIKLIPSNYTIVAERYGIQQRYKVTIKYPTMLEININKPPMVGQIPGVGINKYFFISIIIVISALLIYFKDYVMETVYDVWHSLARL